MAEMSYPGTGAVLGAGAPDALETSSTFDLNTPIRGFRFLVEFVGAPSFTMASFKEVSISLELGFGVERYREGGFARLVGRPIPGKPDDPGDIELTKGIYANNYEMYKFLLGYYSGENTKVIDEVIIRTYHTNGNISSIWHVVNAFPTKYSFGGGSFSADDSAVLTEKLTLANEGFWREEVAAG